MERDAQVLGVTATPDNFNSHAHVERDSPFPLFLLDKCHFNSHAHVERDKGFKAYAEVIGISTHTLTWSVTTSFISPPRLSKISTHTLTWSVTVASKYILLLSDISTHTLTWSVTIWAVGYGLVESISTHTLTWSVTCCQGRDTDERNFNSHAHVERDT